MKLLVNVFLLVAILVCFVHASQEHGKKFVSDGSDFVFRKDHVVTRTKKSLPKTCMKFFNTLAEKQKYANLLTDELKANTLLQNGWQEASKKASSRNILNHGLTEEEKLALVTYTLDYPSVYETFNEHTRLYGFDSQ